MYAVIETGGKQYRVEVGTELEVELLDVEPGQSITLDRVLLVADGADAAVGTPVVDERGRRGRGRRRHARRQGHRVQVPARRRAAASRRAIART